MFSLVQPLAYNNPLAFYLFFTFGSTIVKHLTWYKLTLDTKKGYMAAISSYISFCALHSKKPWPTSTTILEQWV